MLVTFYILSLFMIKRYILFIFLFCIFNVGCENSSTKKYIDEISADNNLVKLSSDISGLDFSNNLVMTEEFNPYTFKSFFNGGGVALGDINNDGLLDIYMSGNLVENKLYLNLGNLKFKDITKYSGLSCPSVWSTGVSMVDINHDGFLDIYVCKSGKPNTPNRANQIFINNKNLTFTDKSKEYGLNFIGLSVHSAFFDYDKDGDLDCYLLNNSIRSVGNYDIASGLRQISDVNGGNKLLKNLEVETGEIVFTDVSEQSGIYSSSIGFGLGVSISDINGDGWDDMFVSNDFFERDYLYINNHDGTFNETITESISELSLGSMGADIADLNNDGRPEIFVTEMLPSDMERYKTKTSFESFDKTQLNVSKGYHNQFGRNVLQYNVGNQNGIPQFLELGRYHNLEATDWSWGALMADFDNNGYRDVFVANGIKKDLLDQDHVNFYSPQQLGNLIKRKEKNVFKNMIESFPSYPINNYYYKQISKDSFIHISFLESQKGFSNGSAYGDLDNDGDLDLVINNVNAKSSILENKSNENHFVQFKLNSNEYNLNGIGAKIRIYVKDEILFAENNPMRGYQSCIDTKIHFGLGTYTSIDSVSIEWPNLKFQNLYNLKSDSLYVLNIVNAKKRNEEDSQIYNKTLLSKVNPLFSFTHKEDNYVDFDENRIQNYFISNETPNLTIGDLNNDKLEDIVISNSKNSANIVLLQHNGSFKKDSSFSIGEKEKESSHILIEDLNGDNTNDLFVVNGGVEFSTESSLIKDNLYLNEGGNRLILSENNFNFQQGCCAASISKPKSNIKNILVAPRIKGTAFGLPTKMAAYKVDGSQFSVNNKLSQSFGNLGMVTDIVVKNINEENDEPEVVIASQFNAITLFKINGDNNAEKILNNGLEDFKGCWNKLEVEDLDNDGDNDIVALNIGLNNRLCNLTQKKMYLLTNDFDGNGEVDNIYCYKKNNKYYPIHLRDEMVMQMPIVKKNVLKYADYASACLSDIFGQEIVNRSLISSINEFRSGVFYNDNGNFIFAPLPKEIQYSEQKAICTFDINNDGWMDLIIGGNQYKAQSQIGMNAASFGHVLLNDQSGGFDVQPFEKSGLFEKGQIRDIEIVKIEEVNYLLIAKNNLPMSFYKINN